MERNVLKNIAIIVLIIFLAFSVVMNLFFIVKNQAERGQGNLLYADKLPRNQTASCFQFNPSDATPGNASLNGIYFGAPPAVLSPKIPLF